MWYKGRGMQGRWILTNSPDSVHSNTVQVYSVTAKGLCQDPSCWRWCNRWGAGGQSDPDTSDWEISADLLGKEKQGKMVENGEEKKENWKREGGKLKMEEREIRKWGEDFFFLSFLFFFFVSLFKTIEICFGSTKMEKLWGRRAFYG